MGSGGVSCVENGSDTSFQLIERQFGQGRPPAEEVQPVRYVSGREDRPKTTAESIARHGIPQGATDRKAHLWR